MTNLKIYRLCRDKKTNQKLKKEEGKYNLPSSEYFHGIDLYEFTRKVIESCPTEYALLCHDDVILPENISFNINQAIKSANNTFGRNKWAIMGNAGVEIISKDVKTFLEDSHTQILPYHTSTPIIVESIDGNTMLLNINILRGNKVFLPKTLSGFHLYDLILSLESYKKGLICLVSSWLYVKHNSGGDYKTFVDASNSEMFQKYFRDSFSNHSITSINGLIKIKRDYKYLSLKAPKQSSCEEIILDAALKLYKNIKANLNILIRIHKPSKKLYRLLEALEIFNMKLPKEIELTIHFGINNISEEEIKPFIKDIKKQFSKLSIIDIYIPLSNKKYPRVNAIEKMIETIPEEENSFSWIIDYDDFIMPEIAKHIQYILANNDIAVGNSCVFREKWNDCTAPFVSEFSHTIQATNIYYLLTGRIFIPICSVIYKTKILKKIFRENRLQGDYFEDYALALLATKDFEYKVFNMPFAGISYHTENTVLEKNRTHWDYGYTTFLAEVINNNIVPKNNYELLNINKVYDLAEFQSFKEGLIWKTLMKYRKIKQKLIKSINN